MFGVRVAIDRQPRTKKGQPAHSTTGVPKASPIQFAARMSMKRPMPPPIMSAIAMRKTGAPNTSASQKRRVMSTSSGFGASSSVTTRGSSAIPQIGQAPGWSRTISGCIGQVYSTFVSAVTSERSGSSAMPHFGQAPGCASRTSGSIGHT
jgi:hypothetical protein